MTKADRYKGATCTDCGNHVDDRVAHDAWHARLDALAARVTRWLGDPEIVLPE